MKHYLEFVSINLGKIEIQEPIGFDGADFNIKQDDGRKGRDVLYAAVDSQLTLNDMPEHYLEYVIETFDRFCSEGIVKYFVEIDGDEYHIGNIDFVTIETDRLTFATFSIIEPVENALFKARFDTKVNQFSDKTLDDENISPCTTQKVLVKAKNISQTSKWSNTQEIVAYVEGTNSLPGYFNVIKNQEQYDIQDSLTWLYDKASVPGEGDTYTSPPQNFKVIRAENNLVRGSAVLKLHLKSEWTNLNPPETNMRVRGRFFKGIDNESLSDFAINEQNGILFYDSGTLDPTHTSYEANTTLNIPLPDLNRGEVLYFVFKHVAGTQRALSKNTFYECELTITYQSVAYNTIVPMVRLIDAMRYTTNSISGLPVTAPRYEFGGEYYDQFICSTPMLRNLLDKPFNITMKDLVEELIQPECNGDYEMTRNNGVFFGFEEDFYRDYLIYDFTQADTPVKLQVKNFSNKINQRYACNLFELGFKNYASQKENEDKNTYDIVHGELQADTRLKLAINTKQVEIGFIRDASYIEQSRRKSFDLSDSSATQDDDKIYILDCVYDTSIKFFTETSMLQHQADGNTLILKNDSSFSWLLLGIVPGDDFRIFTGDNEGQYTVVAVTGTALTLQSQVSPVDIDEENTKYAYRVSSDVTYVARTNEGFQTIAGVADTSRYTNLRFTLKRIMRSRYNNWLGTATSYNGGKPVKITDYVNNPDGATQLTNESAPVIEGADYTPTSKILTPYLYECTIPMEMSDFFIIQEKVQTERGYVKLLNVDGLPLKGYIREMSWHPTELGVENPMGEANLTLEEKYQQFYLTIFKAQQGIFIINGDESSPLHSFDWEFDLLGKVTLFDDSGKAVTPKVPYDKVQVNNSGNATSATELMQWLTSIQ